MQRCTPGVVVPARSRAALSADRKGGQPLQDGGAGRGSPPLRGMAGARRELRVLLAARPGQARDSVRDAARVRLSAEQDALGSLLLRDGIYLESLGPGGGGRARSGVLPGAWAE